jgi:hypothetical protein
MKRNLALFVMALFCCVPMLRAQSSDHVEFGGFGEYLRLERTSPQLNLVGLGGRVAFNVRPSIQLEAEMSYDFRRSITNTFSDGVTLETVNTQFHTLTGLFGPKFSTGSGPVRLFLTGKVGFINFTTANVGATAGFKGALGAVTDGNAKLAVYPGGGIEAFAGPIGVRAEIGDEIYFDGGARNNPRVTFGPQLRF